MNVVPMYIDASLPNYRRCNNNSFVQCVQRVTYMHTEIYTMENNITASAPAIAREK